MKWFDNMRDIKYTNLCIVCRIFLNLQISSKAKLDRFSTDLAVFFLLQVMYGGRAIDDFDRRILRTYMDEYMGDFIFDSFQPFHFYQDETVDYCIPEVEVPKCKDEFLCKIFSRKSRDTSKYNNIRLSLCELWGTRFHGFINCLKVENENKFSPVVDLNGSDVKAAD